MSNIFKQFADLDIENDDDYTNNMPKKAAKSTKSTEDVGDEEEFITISTKKNRGSKVKHDDATESFPDESEQSVIEPVNEEHLVLNKLELERLGFFKKFNSEWNLWYHHELNNWRIDGYQKIFHIKNIKDFWDLHNNIDCIGGITNQQFFMMKDNILPIWEDTFNRNGGSWSIKLNDISSVYTVWLKLAMLMVGETIVKDERHRQNKLVVGLSVNLRNQNTCIIKIWNRDSNLSSINLLHDDIVKEFGYNIIYKKNIVEY